MCEIGKIKLYGEGMCSYKIAQKINEVIDNLNERRQNSEQDTNSALILSDVSVSFAEFLLTHKQSDEVQKATAHQLFKEFIEAYER